MDDGAVSRVMKSRNDGHDQKAGNERCQALRRWCQSMGANQMLAAGRACITPFRAGNEAGIFLAVVFMAGQVCRLARYRACRPVLLSLVSLPCISMASAAGF